MRVYHYSTFADAYYASLQDLMTNPDWETKPRDLKIKENTNVALIIENPLSCLYQNEVRSSQKKYISAELLWYFMGRNDVDFISKYAKFWNSIKNSDNTVNSAYGHLLFSQKNYYGLTQYEWAISSLLKDPDSRQAILHFNTPMHQYSDNKDFVCTVYGIFQIRGNKLNFTTHMRSNDVVWGLPTDIAFFAILQSQALSHLKIKYPQLELGTYTHIANSYHVYEHHFEIVNKMLASPFVSEELPPVNLDLIDSCGFPTLEFYHFFKNPQNKIQDPLLEWIQTYFK
jgi:thymidylate synthase